MPWTKPIPFRKTVLSTSTDVQLTLPLSGIQNVRILNLWAAQLGYPAEIDIAYSFWQESTQLWMTLKHTVGEYCTFNAGRYKEIWTDELRADFDTDDSAEKAFYFGGEYQVKK